MSLKYYKFFFVCVVLIFPLCWAIEDSPVISIDQGKLKGIENLSRDGRKFYSYLGIPYGKSERFEYSEPAENWDGIKDATKFGESCLQFNIFGNNFIGGENCLFLNVYTPRLSSASDMSKLPVMVFIHGGGFQSGASNEYGAKYFMDEDVILVTINYRVGPFGLTDTGFGSNFGLKDQNLALKWVNKNIESFGGDKKSITIFGESAGGISVAFHMVSPLSKGLFHKAISQSGSPHNPLIPVGVQPPEFTKLGHLMGCPSKATPQDLLTCLKKVDGLSTLKTINGALTTPGYRFEEIPQIVVTIEKDGGKDAFLPDAPLNLLKKGDYPRIPWISGINTNEGIVSLLLHPGIQALNKNGPHGPNWNAIAPKAFGYDDNDTKTSEEIQNFYFGKNETAMDEENMRNMFSDYTFIHPAKASAEIYSKYAPVYLYYFSLKGVASYFNDSVPQDADGLRVPAHGDELQYLFNFEKLFPEIYGNSRFADFSDAMVKLWVSFAKNVIISTNDAMNTNASQWTPLSNSIDPNDDIQWYNLDHESKMVPESGIFGSRLKFWDNLFPKP